MQASVAVIRGFSSRSSWALEQSLSSGGAQAYHSTKEIVGSPWTRDPRLLHWEADSFTTEGPGKPQWVS